MRRILILAALLLASSVAGQTKKTTYTKHKATKAATHTKQTPLAGGGYAYPLLNVEGLYSANFGEMRPRHFHAGIDIKTDGVVGKTLVAMADGYIIRAGVSSGGYGRALYVAQNDGRTAVYGHIDRFREDIEQMVEKQRRAKKSNNVELNFSPQELPVKRGEKIAYAGNSGSSFGPHLHIEMRDSAGSTLNCVRMGIFKPQDDIPPIIMQLHYVQIDTLQGVPIHTQRQSYHVALIGGGRYKLLHEGAVKIGEKGYLVVEASDRRNGVHNRFGVYRATLKCDSTTIFEYRIDKIRAGDSRGCDAVAYYPIQSSTSNEAIRLARMDQAPEYLYPTLLDRGIVRSTVGQKLAMTIEVEDDCGNISKLNFDALGTAQIPISEPDSGSIILRPDRATTIRIDDCMSAQIPQWGLHEPIFCKPECLGKTPSSEGLVALSPTYRILDDKTPLRQNMSITILAEVPLKLQSRCALALCKTSGGFSYIGGKYRDGALIAKTGSTGEVLLMADTIPPRITPLFKQGVKLSNSTILRFKISDNFSGIEHYSLRINGEWQSCERYPIKGTLEAKISGLKNDKSNLVELTVVDGCGNSANWREIFY